MGELSDLHNNEEATQKYARTREANTHSRARIYADELAWPLFFTPHMDRSSEQEPQLTHNSFGSVPRESRMTLRDYSVPFCAFEALFLHFVVAGEVQVTDVPRFALASLGGRAERLE